jgi:immune inhibitor A
MSEVENSHLVYCLWKGIPKQEYFLLETRCKVGYDKHLPAEGLLIWHIDEAISDNTNETHYMVGLVQADGKKDLELSVNTGDDGDPFPGSSQKILSVAPPYRTFVRSRTKILACPCPADAR